MYSYYGFLISQSQPKKVPPDWERASFQQGSQASPGLKPSPQNGATFSSSGVYGQGSLIADEESQEFDDLIFALKTGMCELTNPVRSRHLAAVQIISSSHEVAKVQSVTLSTSSFS